MLDITNYWLFILSVFLLTVTPGPDMAYIIGQSVANGKKAGVISATGVALGSCTHAVASTVGLTALIVASPVMFSVIKYIGAAYLMFLGGKMILSSFAKKKVEMKTVLQLKTGVSSGSLLAKGFFTTLTNPKVLLFFISFFPQFVVPGGAHHASSFLLLGLSYALIGFAIDLSVAYLAGSATGAAFKSKSLQHLLERIVGATFIALGLRLALTHR